MDPELLRTCQQGDIEKLRKLFDTRSPEFFLTQNEEKKNILHILSSPRCAKEALERLPKKAVRQLVCQPDSNGDNPLHLAFSLDIARLIVDAYKSSDDGVDQSYPPWKAKNNDGKLPVQDAVTTKKDDVAEFLLSVDDNDFLRNVDNAGSLLELAIEKDAVDIIEMILNIDATISYDLQNEDGENPLHIAVERGRLKIAQILVDAFNEYLKRQVEGDKEAAAHLLSLQPPWRQMDRKERTPLHRALVDGYLDLAKVMLSSDFAFLSCLVDHSEQDSPNTLVKELEDSKEFRDVYLDTFLQFIRDNRENAVRLLKRHPELFKCQDSSGKMTIIRNAITDRWVDIIKTILNIDTSISYDLQNEDGENPLHIAVERGRLKIAQILVDAFNEYLKRQVEGDKEAAAHLLSFQPPWRQTDDKGITPLHLALKHRHLATVMLSSDFAYLSCWADHSEQDSPKSLVKELEDSIDVTEPSFTRDFRQVYRFTLQRFIRNNRENAVRLLKRHPELFECQDSSGKMKIIRNAITDRWVDIIKTIFNIDTSTSYDLRNGDGRNPLHIAVELGRPMVVKIIAEAFNNYFKRQVEGDKEEAAHLLSFQPPWRQTDDKGITPLHLALKHQHLELAAHLLSSDFAYLSGWADHSAQDSPKSLVKELEDSIDVTEPSFTRDFRQVYPFTLQRFIRDNRGDASRKLITQHPELVQFQDNDGRAILHYALDKNDVDTMRFILRVQHSAVNIQDDRQEHLLIKACKKGNLSAIEAICDICPEVHARGKEETTPLHNVKLQSREAYQELLDIPAIARQKNETDAYGRSPIIKAIEDRNLELAETLLDKSVYVTNVKSQNGKTAVALLKDKSKESTQWANLYKRAAELEPLGTDVKDIRDRLSIQAALLATITFAAAFTVPGGFDQNNGDVILGQKPAFIIFILSDTYAMCCSMIVLYALIWVAAQETDVALKLINFSVNVLNHSFYGTLGAFMTGVYTMMSSKSIWVAIIVLVMCSTVMISAYIIIRFRLVDSFVYTCLSRKKSFVDTIIKPICKAAKKEAEPPV